MGGLRNHQGQHAAIKIAAANKNERFFSSTCDRMLWHLVFSVADGPAIDALHRFFALFFLPS